MEEAPPRPNHPAEGCILNSPPFFKKKNRKRIKSLSAASLKGSFEASFEEELCLGFQTAPLPSSSTETVRDRIRLRDASSLSEEKPKLQSMQVTVWKKDDTDNSLARAKISINCVCRKALHPAYTLAARSLRKS